MPISRPAILVVSGRGPGFHADAAAHWLASRAARHKKRRKGYTLVMEPEMTADAIDRSTWPVWKGRVGEREPPTDYSHLTPSQRIELVWEATKNAWSMTGAPLDESSFRRDVESIARRGR